MMRRRAPMNVRLALTQFTKRPGHVIFELFLHHSDSREVKYRANDGASYSLEVPEDEWLRCCSALGVLPPPLKSERRGSMDSRAKATWEVEKETRMQARKALQSIFESVNKRRDELLAADGRIASRS